MAITDADRKRNERARNAATGLAEFRMKITTNEREAISEAAALRGYTDLTEYLVRMAMADRDTSRKLNVCTYPTCNCPFDKGPDNLCLRGKPNPEQTQ